VQVASSAPPGSPPRPSPLPAFVAYSVGFVLTIVSSAVLVFAVAFARTGGRQSGLAAEATRFALSAPGMIGGALAGAVALASVALAAAILERRPLVARLRLAPTRATPLGAVAVSTGLVGLSFATGTLAELLGLRGGGVMDALAESLRSPAPARLLAAILAIGVAPALAEETFFRGLLQTRLVASWGRWPAIVTASAAFGLIHLSGLQGSLALLAGLFLGWSAERLGGIRPTIAAHMVNNLVFLGLATLGSIEAPSRAVEIAIVVAGATVTAASTAILRSRLALRA
jgi:membrane protease YdiL (CAAX protease family)